MTVLNSGTATIAPFSPQWTYLMRFPLPSGEKVAEGRMRGPGDVHVAVPKSRTVI
jgi:hypothetical protein